MARRGVLLTSIFLLVAGSSLAQHITNRVVLQVVVTYEGERQPIQDQITVVLMDGWGSVAAEQETTHGIVQFLTVPGLHRIRIIGPTVEQFDTEFDIRDGEGSEARAFQVRRKSSDYLLTTPSNAIPAVRLKIPRKAAKEFEKGARAMDDKNWQEARMSFEKAIAIYPSYDQAYYGAGMADLNMRNMEAARRAFEKAISLNDGYGEAYRSLAKVLMAERKYDEVDSVLKKALRSEPLDLWTLTYAAYAELLTGKFDEAITNAQKVLALPHQGFASAHIVAARALEATHRPNEALAEYQLYLKEDPQGRDAGSARAAVGRIATAVRR